jgi:hypothetical protein
MHVEPESVGRSQMPNPNTPDPKRPPIDPPGGQPPLPGEPQRDPRNDPTQPPRPPPGSPPKIDPARRPPPRRTERHGRSGLAHEKT